MRLYSPKALWPVYIVVSLCLAFPAQAYVCSRVPDTTGSETGPSLSWYTRDLSYSIAAEDLPSADTAVIEEIFASSFAAWSNADSCNEEEGGLTDLRFEAQTCCSSGTTIGYNFLTPTENENLLIYRSVWPHPHQAGNVIALTTTTYNSLSGEIFDADIEFNDEDFDFTLTDTNPQTDLMNTAVHEIGHVLGLGHTSVNNATMEADATLGEISKRDLECDDKNAITFKYPANQENDYCELDEINCNATCTPPGTLDRSVVIDIAGYDDGIAEGVGCNANKKSSIWILLLLTIGVILHHRKRPHKAL
ncbi:MAG: matrixin family metalloprotease [Myxococcota bacterium]|jgi:hypothetical protein|nr:matrixin family metalloprotease [Myxococcota bacterium]